MKSNNTININGKLYDARTGELIDQVNPTKARANLAESKKIVEQPKASSTSKSHKPTNKRGNGFVDGIAKNPNSSKTPAKLDRSPSKKSVSSNKPKAGVTHHVTTVHQKPKRSATLNRAGVKSPKLSAPDAKEHVSAKMKSTKPPLHRVERAKATKKSELISRFAQPHAIMNSHSETGIDGPTESKLSMRNVAHAAEQSKSTKSSQDTKHRLINESLSVASSSVKKEKAPRVKHSPKIFHFMSGGLAAVVLLGYVTYLNVPSVSMKVASSRAGFSATLPSQSPAGYKLQGPIAYSPGQVVIKFGSNTDERHFTVSQQPTAWDSEALKENFVDKESSLEPQTYNDRGLTIYLYNGGDAAWVDAGKFYSIKAENSQLDTNQILDLATSM